MAETARSAQVGVTRPSQTGESSRAGANLVSRLTPKGRSPFWFSRLPRLLVPWIPGFSDVIADGAWIWSGRPLSLLVPLLALVVGLLTPLRWTASSQLYLGSLPFIGLVTASAAFSGPISVLLVLGYIGGDLLHNAHELALPLAGGQSEWVRALGWSGGRTVSYLLLAVPALALPQLGRSHAGPLPIRLLPSRLTLKLRGRSATIHLPGQVLDLLASGLIVYIWSQGLAILVRPAFSWRGLALPSQSRDLIQTDWLWLVAVAIIATALREAIDLISRRSARLSLFAAKARQLRWASEERRGYRWRQLPAPLQVAVPAGLTTLVLSGLYRVPNDALIVAVICVVLQSWRSFGAPRMPRLTNAVRRVPPVVRLVVVCVVGYAGYLLGAALLHPPIDPATSPLPLFGALVALVCGHLCFPPLAIRRAAGSKPLPRLPGATA